MRRMNRGGLVLSALLGWLSLGCGRAAPLPSHHVIFRATEDPGRPLAGVTFSADGRVLGRSNAEGRLQVDLAGADGRALPVEVRCPDGYRQPDEPVTVHLRSFERLDPRDGPQGIEVRVSCAPEERTAVLVVRAEHAEGAPVRVDGQVVGVLGPQEVLHVRRRAPPGTTFDVAIDTSERPRLRPKSPARRFTLEDRDALFLFDAKLVEQAPKPRRRRARRPKKPAHRLPERID